jgi:hypothetical protein
VLYQKRLARLVPATIAWVRASPWHTSPCPFDRFRVKTRTDSVRLLALKRMLLSLPVLALVLWLAFSSSPSGRRERELNALINQGKLGSVDPELAKRLQLQFPWLARHAGVAHPVAINAPIDRSRLTLVVTTPAYERVTQCGSGNALFDPELNVIFIDQSLLWPTEVNIIGSPCVNSMFTINDYEYIVSYTKFILAHELGHWQKHRRAAVKSHALSVAVRQLMSQMLLPVRV